VTVPLNQPEKDGFIIVVRYLWRAPISAFLVPRATWLLS